jgi:hypothetical protein
MAVIMLPGACSLLSTAGPLKRVAGFFPTLYTAAENLDIRKPFVPVFCCPTGSTRLF